MKVETVTTSDGSMLRSLRSILSRADDVLMCVAFVHEKGLRLVANELKALRQRTEAPPTFALSDFAFPHTHAKASLDRRHRRDDRKAG